MQDTRFHDAAIAYLMRRRDGSRVTIEQVANEHTELVHERASAFIDAETVGMDADEVEEHLNEIGYQREVDAQSWTRDMIDANLESIVALLDNAPEGRVTSELLDHWIERIREAASTGEPLPLAIRDLQQTVY